jgi:hypothetical protein
LEVLQWGGDKAALGMKTYVVLPLVEVIWRCCNGRGGKAALGISGHVFLPLKEVIWRCNGRGGKVPNAP